MGNCQAVDAAALVIQHPNGKVERMYWPVTANQIMKLNPGHYVSLIIPLPMSEHDSATTTTTSATTETGGGDPKKKTVRYTRVKLLRPSDTLVLGRAYRLVTSQGWYLYNISFTPLFGNNSHSSPTAEDNTFCIFWSLMKFRCNWILC